MEMMDELKRQLEEMTKKHEKSDNKLRRLKILADKAIDDFEDLKEKYTENQTQYKVLKRRLTETETKLQSLENVLEPAVAEYGELQMQYQIEKDCRSEAEKYASKLTKENRQLKRKSQVLLQKIQLVDIKIDEPEPEVELDQPDVDNDKEDGRNSLNMKIQVLEERNKKLEEVLETVENEKFQTFEREKGFTYRIEELESKLEQAKQREKDQEEELNNFKRVSQVLVQEFQELKDKHDKEMQLKYEAEKYAHEMLSERDAVIRESSILLASVSSDKRIVSALLTIEDLTKTLATERLNYHKELTALNEELNSLSNDAQQKQVVELENRLQLAVEENERVFKTTTDMEKTIRKLETENKSLLSKLEAFEDRLRPPPPPPPPPPPSEPSRFSPLRLFIKKKDNDKASKSNNRSFDLPLNASDSVRNKSYEEALKEMMDRIKSGRALKSTASNQGQASIPEEKDSAITNLQELLGSLKSSKHQRRGLPFEDNNESQSELELAHKIPLKRLLVKQRGLPQSTTTTTATTTKTTEESELSKVFRTRVKIDEIS